VVSSFVGTLCGFAVLLVLLLLLLLLSFLSFSTQRSTNSLLGVAFEIRTALLMFRCRSS